MYQEMYDNSELRGMIEEAMAQASAFVRELANAAKNPLVQVWAMQREINITLDNNVRLNVSNDGNFEATTTYRDFKPVKTVFTVQVEGKLHVPFVGAIHVEGRLKSIVYHDDNLANVENDLHLNYTVNGSNELIWVDSWGRVSVDVTYRDCGCGRGEDCGVAFLFEPEVNVSVETLSDANCQYFEANQVTLTHPSS